MNKNEDSDDEVPQLRPDTLAALQEFYRECEEKQPKNDQIEENWQLSQFWYDDETIERLVHGAVKSTNESASIALISCPSLYKKLKEISGPRIVKLFEYDRRFSIFGDDYIMYDYKIPLEVPQSMQKFYDLVICDPPFLSEECLVKFAITVRFLAKNNIVICTGAVMEKLAEKLLGVKKCNFVPHHKNNLANEFFCYSNFIFDEYL